MIRNYITAFFSNSPKGTTSDQTGRDSVVLNRLLELGGFPITLNPGAQPVRVADPEIFDVIVELYTYVNMVIEELNVIRVPGNAGGLEVQITVKQFEIIENEFFDVEIVKDIKGATNMQSKIQNRAKTGRETQTDVSNSSFIVKGVDSLKGLIGL